MLARDPENARAITPEAAAGLRWQAFTKRDATLDGDGRTFAQIAQERAT